ncbi:MAG TPA: hypothetical protein VMD05_07660 [Candidatus Nanoarchaeia archaeon]|nr:hypothetical protein [Candidatus Nanoarchaeia archaeon]
MLRVDICLCLPLAKARPLKAVFDGVTILAAFKGNLLNCENGSLPTGFAANGACYSQLP